MNLPEVFDLSVKPPEYSLTWEWEWGHGITRKYSPSYVDILHGSTDWLQTNIGPLSDRYVLHGEGPFKLERAKFSIYTWDMQLEMYVIKETSYDPIAFNHYWNALVDRLQKLTGGELGNVNYIEYEGCDGCERWVYVQRHDATFTDIGSSHSTHIIIAFVDEVMALQCKLAVS
jgi:hypothetical protein